MTKVPNVTKVIANLSTLDGKIKFEGDTATYVLAPNVLEKVDFEKYKIRRGSSVEVGIDNGSVNFLKKVKAPEQAEAPEAQTSTPTSEVKTYTIQSVAASKEVLKFKDYPFLATEVNHTPWIKVGAELAKQDFQALGLVARATVTAKFETVDGKETVVEMKAVPKKEEAKPAWQGKPKWQGKSNNYDSPERQTSIEAQASVNSACEIVSNYTLNKEMRVEEVNKMIADIARANFALIQSLKQTNAK